jgi:6-phosphogluconolactonase
MTQQLNWHSLANAEALAIHAAKLIVTAANHAISTRGSFKLVLAGGGTPQDSYGLLLNAQTDWNRWHIYYGDERCLPANDTQRNNVMANTSFLQHSSIPKHQIYPIATELGNELAAINYQSIIKPILPFDLVLLGMGEDGHTASLFPGHQHNQHELVHAVYDSPKPPAERVSLSAKALTDSQQIIFLISRKNKQQALKNWQQGENLPVTTIAHQHPIEILLTD